MTSYCEFMGKRPEPTDLGQNHMTTLQANAIEANCCWAEKGFDHPMILILRRAASVA